jgi:hypothetical protein
MARLVGYAHAGVDPAYMGIGPVPAVRKVLERTGISLEQIDVIEANEAFAAQACAVMQELGMDPARVNPNGSGISLGHPGGRDRRNHCGQGDPRTAAHSGALRACDHVHRWWTGYRGGFRALLSQGERLQLVGSASIPLKICARLPTRL